MLQNDEETNIASSAEIGPSAERNKAVANWDPSYTGEKVNWYGEYIARHGPLSMSWLQPASKHNDPIPSEKVETKGLGLHRAEHIIAPLEDGSVCIWNIRNHWSTERSRGAICSRSKPGILTTKEPLLNLSSGINGVVSVDDERDKAYIATQNYVQEVDLHTLSVSTQQRFTWTIATLSDFAPNVPLSVGTKSGLHLYDPRQKVRQESSGSVAESIENPASFLRPASKRGDFSSQLSNYEAKNYASLFQPGPTSILHLFPHGSIPSPSLGEIIIAGRFPSLLMYDRRMFPKLGNTFHSGAQLCSLASLPYSFRSLETELMRKNQLSVRAAQEAKSQAGDTLFACGEYHGKGSLEIYGLSSDRTSSATSKPAPGSPQISTFKNRVSASRSKLLSIATHGTRLIVSDGDGQLRWLERDGHTLVRKWAFNRKDSLADYLAGYDGSSNYDVALKMIPIHPGLADVTDVSRDEILVWTGEKIGMLSFSKEPRFGGEDGQAWEERAETAEEAMKRREERVYGETMRRALQRQADEVRWVTGLGLMG